jgi:selenocysteine lyase/cysteine desulfurase
MTIIRQANHRFKENNLNKRIVVYGDSNFDVRANVITLNILSNKTIIQHSFASLIFADVFGIQLRSGCFCAGPFGMKLLNLDEQTTKIIED